MVVAHFGVHFGRNRIVLVVLAVSALVFARIGANWLELVRVWKRKKKKKNNMARTHGQQRRTPHAALVRIGCGCGSLGAAPVLSRFAEGLCVEFLIESLSGVAFSCCYKGTKN